MLVDEENQADVLIDEVEVEDEQIAEDSTEDEKSSDLDESEEESEHEEVDTEISIEGYEEESPTSEGNKVSFVTELRKQNREAKKRLEELSRELEQLKGSSKQEQQIVLGKKPVLEDFGYDEELHQKAIDLWIENKLAFEKQEQLRSEADAKQAEYFRSVQNSYEEKKKELNIPDYQERAEIVAEKLGNEKSILIMTGADNPAKLVAALARYPKLLNELAEINDAAKFAVKIGKIEGALTMKSAQKRAPEKMLSSGKSGGVSSSKELDRLRAEAQKTGDMSKVIAYKRKMKEC